MPRPCDLVARLSALWLLVSLFCCESGSGKPEVTLTSSLVPVPLPNSMPVKTALGLAQASGYRSTAIDQHLKLLSLLTLGIHCQVDRILIPVVAARYHVAETATMWAMFRYSAQSQASLWDLSTINSLLRKYNIKSKMATSHKPPPGIVMLPSYSYQAHDIRFIAADVARVSQEFMANNSNASNLTLFAPDLLLAFQTRELPLYAEVAAAIKFASKLVASAQAIVLHLERVSPLFNGLHLHIAPPEDVVNELVINNELMQYAEHIKALQFGTAPVYLTTGVFDMAVVPDTYHTLVEDWIKGWLVTQGHATVVINRHIALNRTDVDDAVSKLLPEQKALIDLLVLQYAQKIVAARSGTFAFVLQEMRAMQQLPKHTMSIVGQPWWLLPIAAGVHGAPTG